MPEVKLNQAPEVKSNPIPVAQEKPIQNGITLSSFISLADTYDDYNQPEFFIFEGREKLKSFGKLVRLHGVSKALEYATEKEKPTFVLRADVIQKFLSDRSVISFCALNGNKFAIVL